MAATAKVGIIIRGSWEASLEEKLIAMTPAGFLAAAAAMQQAPPNLFAWTGGECNEVARWIERLGTSSVVDAVGLGR